MAFVPFFFCSCRTVRVPFGFGFCVATCSYMGFGWLHEVDEDSIAHATIHWMDTFELPSLTQQQWLTEAEWYFGEISNCLFVSQTQPDTFIQPKPRNWEKALKGQCSCPAKPAHTRCCSLSLVQPLCNRKWNHPFRLKCNLIWKKLNKLSSHQESGCVPKCIWHARCLLYLAATKPQKFCTVYGNLIRN